MKPLLSFTNLTQEKRLVVNHIPVLTLYECKKNKTNHKAKRHLQTLSLIYPFAIHLFKNVFAGHCCLASPFLAREESAPWAFHSLVHPFTVTQANRPVSQLHSIPAVPHSQQMGNPNTFPATP